jgi:G3E family GTPase
MGEPVGSCTDFVAAVANPIKIHYKDSFQFAPFSTMVDPDRVRELLLGETPTSFPEEVSYLFQKQLEESDILALNKIDLLKSEEKKRLLSALTAKYPEKRVMPLSAKEGAGMEEWLEILLSEKPGANTVLRQIDYDRYARAEAVLGWLNTAVKISSPQPYDAAELAGKLISGLKGAFQERDAEIGHLKFVITSDGKTMWANLTRLAAEPAFSGHQLGSLSGGTLILNARVRLDPAELEPIVRDTIKKVFEEAAIQFEILDLQCFSPAYPQPPYLVREEVQVKGLRH